MASSRSPCCCPRPAAPRLPATATFRRWPARRLPPPPLCRLRLARTRRIDGRAFPDHVLALTWDDGPDQSTLRLASYLASHRISATFFVVDEWAGDLSEEPGRGAHEFETGYRFIPVLGDLVALGHRLGNHTANHVLLASAKASVVDFELRENQKNIDPFLTNELRVFRSPGGAWDDDAGVVVDSDPALGGLVGPVRWDIDRKDWEASLYCRSDRPAVECEPAAPGHRSRVRAEVTARRYLDSIAKTGRGIVLFHDRVGDVGSDYALRVARHVIPDLEARGYVFAPPVLAFSPFRPRLGDPLTADWVASLDPSTMTFTDVDGDGRADLCGRGTGGFGCARSVERPGTSADGRPETVFAWSREWSAAVRPQGRVRSAASALQGDSERRRADRRVPSRPRRRPLRPVRAAPDARCLALARPEPRGRRVLARGGSGPGRRQRRRPGRPLLGARSGRRLRACSLIRSPRGGVLEPDGPLLDRNGRVLVQEAPVLFRNGRVLLQEGPVLFRNGRVLLGEARVLVQEAPVLLGNGRVPVQEAPVLLREARVLLGNGRVLLGEARVLVQEAPVLLGNGRVPVQEAPVLLRDAPVPDPPYRSAGVCSRMMN